MKKLALSILFIGLAIGLTSCDEIVDFGGVKVYNVTASTTEGKEFIKKHKVKYVCKEVFGFLGADFIRSRKHVYVTNFIRTKNGDLNFKLISSIEFSPIIPKDSQYAKLDYFWLNRKLPKKKIPAYDSSYLQAYKDRMIYHVDKYGLKPDFSWWNKYGFIVLTALIVATIILTPRQKNSDDSASLSPIEGLKSDPDGPHTLIISGNETDYSPYPRPKNRGGPDPE